MSGSFLENIQAVDVRGERVGSEDLREEKVRQSVVSILGNNILCSIATVTADDRPHINVAYFSYTDRFEIFFLSHPGALHCRNLSSNPSMGMTVFSSVQQWTDPGRGVQLFGTCQETSGSSSDEAERSYQDRFPAYKKWKTTLRNNDLARQYRFYRFDVTSVKILDEKNLGDAVFVRASIIRR
jgi:uncharacterized protein YhbP (UPF0306 family)